MPAARHPLRLLVAAVACAATLPLLGAPPAAAEGARSGTPLVGELVQGFADPGPDAHTAGASDEGTLLSWVRTAPGEAVRVPTEDVEDVPAGATIEVTLGGLVRDEASAEGLAPARDVLAAQVVAASEPATAPATGPVNHEVTVVMLQPANSAQDSTTLAQVVDLVNGPVADFWRRESDGAVRFGVVAGHDWTGQPSTVDCSRPFDLWKEAAARARWTSGPGRHLLVYVPWGTRGCAYGLGTVGPAIDSGGMSYVQAAVTSVVAHEFGHNLGLSHAAGLQCDRSVEESGTSACQVDDYGDRYDVMGVSWQQVGSLGAPHAALLGLLPPGSAPSVNAGAPAAEYTLAPLGSRTGTRAVQLTTVDGTRYWLEYRTPTGQDSWLGTPDSWPGLESGVLLRRAISTDNRTSLLLDPTPSAQTGWDGDLAVTMGTGASTSVGRGAFTVTVLEATTSGARVRIGTNGVAHPIDVAYERLGGASVLGEPTGPRVCGLRDGGCRRTYANGALYWTPGTGAHLVQGDIGARWAGLGHEGGWLGYPTTDVVCGLRAGGCYQVFQGGALYWSSATGARAV
ncbi:zinc-dependent metalloprotease family protein, partial [Geodermatophilus sp. SYSU D01186]